MKSSTSHAQSTQVTDRSSLESPDAKQQPSKQGQSAGNIQISGEKNALNLINSAGKTQIDQSHHIIYNYYYREETQLISKTDETDQKDDLPCPYRGLFHFGPDDADYFFGRTSFVTALEKRVTTHTFTPVFGASGSGKSSAVLAGLVPRLQKTGHWLFSHFRPGDEPFRALALALAPLYLDHHNETEQIAQARQLEGYLKAGDISLTDIIKKINQQHPTQRVLLIADQFEELYTLCTDDETRHLFLDCLLAGLNSRLDEGLESAQNVPLVLVATMRADFLANALAYRPFADTLQKGDIKLGAMDKAELREVIEEPAAKLGVTFEAGLVARILEDVEAEPGNLPLLEFALTELWKKRSGKRLTHAAYDAIGEVEGSLARYAGEQFEQLSEQKQAEVRRIFVQLVQPGAGTEDTRRIATKAELGDERWKVVKQLADTRLVVTGSNQEQNEIVEVVHEALIRHWGDLRQWMDTDREFRAWQERLRGAIHQWETTGHDEGALLRGAALAEARERLQARKEDLGAGECGFIRASTEAQRREKRKKVEAERTKLRQARRWAAGLGALALVAGGTGMRNLQQRYEIGREKVRAEVISSSYVMDAHLEDGLEKEAVLQALQTGQTLQERFSSDDISGQTFRAVASIRDVISGVREKTTLFQHSDDVYAVAYSPDGKRMATAGADRTIRLWDTEGNEVRVFENHENHHDDEITSIAFSPNENVPFLVTGSKDNTAKIWEVKSGKLVAELKGHSDDVMSVAFSPSGKVIATASADDTVKLWNVSDRQSFITLGGEEGHRDGVMSVAFNPNNEKMLATASDDGAVKLWNVEGKNFTTIPAAHDGREVYSVAFDPTNEDVLASAGLDKIVRVWNTKGESLNKLEAHSGGVHTVAFDKEGRLATGSFDKTVKLWSADGKVLQTFRGHRYLIHSVAFSADGTTLASASRDRTVKLWNLATTDSSKRLEQIADIESVAFSPNGQMIATAGRDGMAKIWSHNGEELANLVGHTGNVRNIAFSPNSDMVVTASGDETVKLWDTEGKLQTSFHDEQNTVVWGVAFHPKDSDRIATVSADRLLRLWDANGNLIKTFAQEHTDIIFRVAFSPDGKTLATVSQDHTIKLWDIGQSESIKTFRDHDGAIADVAFDKSGRRLVSAGLDDHTAKVWDIHKAEPLATLRGHRDQVWSAAFSPQGNMIATAGYEGTVKFWDLNGTEIETFRGHEEMIFSVAFNPETGALATASGDNTVKLWEFELSDLMAQGCKWIAPYALYDSPEFMMNLEVCQGTDSFDQYLQSGGAERLFESGEALARQENTEEAIKYWKQAVLWRPELEDHIADSGGYREKSKNMAEAQRETERGIAAAERGKLDAAFVHFETSKALDAEGISGYEWRDLCWYGIQHDASGQSVLSACEEATQLKPETNFDYKSRGIAHALVGKKEAAIHDFEVLLRGESEADKKRANVYQWILSLKADENPFTAEMLASLKKEGL